VIGGWDTRAEHVDTLAQRVILQPAVCSIINIIMRPVQPGNGNC
jgi:hypothetical protein